MLSRKQCYTLSSRPDSESDRDRLCMAQRDVVLRWIQQAARVIARLLRSGKPGDLELAQIEVDSAVEALLGSLARLIPTLDA